MHPVLNGLNIVNLIKERVKSINVLGCIGGSEYGFLL